MLKLKWLWVVCFVALIAWTGFSFAQTANPGAIKTPGNQNRQVAKRPGSFRYKWRMGCLG